MAIDPFRLIADRKIKDAMEEGAFDNLAGTGRPLPLDDDPFEDPELWMAHRLLRNNGFAPRWIEDGKDIEAARDRLRAELTCGRIAADEFRRQAAALNRRIAAYNILAPSISVHKLPLDIEGECARVASS